MSSVTNARLVDRLRRRIPEAWRLWIYGLIKSSVGARRLVHRTLINSREERFIEQVLTSSQAGPWRDFEASLSTVGFTERVVEIPWVLSRYQGEKRVLDVGTSFAMPVYVQALRDLHIQDLVGVDIVPLTLAGIRMLKADVREMPFDDGHLDLILCISTLEHIGRDGSPLAVSDGDLYALREMGRTLNRSGRLLVSVPFGKAEIHPWFRQYDFEGWAALVDAAGLRSVELAYYVYSPRDGWGLANDPAQLSKVSYQTEGATAATGLLCACLMRAAGTSQNGPA
jgi:SAM-dependent methyltransferase